MLNIKITNTENRGSIDIDNVSGGNELVNINGFNPPIASIGTTEKSIGDGSTLSAVHLTERYLTIVFATSTDRQTLLKVLRPSDKVYLDLTGTTWDNVALPNGATFRSLRAFGYIEICEIAYMNMRTQVSLSIRCPDPYFYIVKEEGGVISFDVKINEVNGRITIPSSYIFEQSPIVIGGKGTFTRVSIKKTGATNSLVLEGSLSGEFTISKENPHAELMVFPVEFPIAKPNLTNEIVISATGVKSSLFYALYELRVLGI